MQRFPGWFTARPGCFSKNTADTFPEVISRKRAFFNRSVIRNLTHRFAAVSEDVRNRLVKYEGLDSEQIDVVYNGVTPDEQLNSKKRDQLRRSFGIGPEDFLVGTAGRFDPVKNLPMLLKSIAAARKKIASIRGLLLGDGPGFEQVRELRDDLELSDTVVMPGHREDARQLIQCMDLFVLSSFSEGTSMALLEAIAAGVPVAVTDVGGNPEVVVDGRDRLGSSFRLRPGLEECYSGSGLRSAQRPCSFPNPGARRFNRRIYVDKMLRSYRNAYTEMLRHKMCGIAGFINFRRSSEPMLPVTVSKGMTDTIMHRGPDEEGFFVDDLAALGHRRLSIIDLASGKQPMGTPDGKVHLVFNGEIYNFWRCGPNSRPKATDSSTRSDTEVILMSYLEWGELCVEKTLRHVCLCASGTAGKKLLLLGRDRVGKKPLYYVSDGPIFAFASELKALRAGEFQPGKIDPEALDCYFSFGYIPAPKTIYEKVKKLRPAHALVVTEKGIRENRYWSLSFADPADRPMDDAADELEGLLDEAVKCRLMSEVPLGAFLSGGLDSPLVVSSMARIGNGTVLSNSIGFEDEKLNELPAARAVAEHLRTDHREFFVRPDAADVLEKIAWHFDEPFADSSAVPTWYVCKMARENVTVALSGDGGDESFGGYTFRYIPHMLESRIRAALPARLRDLAFGPLGAIYPGSARLPKPCGSKRFLKTSR